MKKKIVLVLLVLVLALPVSYIANATSVDANPHIYGASIVLNSSMSATFTCSCHYYYDISVYDVKLEVRNFLGIWSFVSYLPSPPGATNVSSLLRIMDYSAYCTVGNTYRISATFDASGETVSRTSAAMRYN